MGGSTSKFEATDWTRATGRLKQASDTADTTTTTTAKTSITLDGSPPTSHYQIIHLIPRRSRPSLLGVVSKLHSHQTQVQTQPHELEFDIVLGKNKNPAAEAAAPLLYTTRAIPGVLTGFDVLRPTTAASTTIRTTTHNNEKESENNQEQQQQQQQGLEVLLRVIRCSQDDNEPENDSNKDDGQGRTWMIFSSRACFDGQRPTTTVLQTEEEDYLSTSSSSTSSSTRTRWYKSVCITVSWSKSTMIVARFGPPSVDYLCHCLEPSLEEDDEEEDTPTIMADHPQEGSETDLNDVDDAGSRSGSILRSASSDSHDELLTAAEMVASRRRRQKTPTSTIASLICDDHDHDDCNEKPLFSSSDHKVTAAAVDKNASCPRGADGAGPSSSSWATREQRRKAAYQRAMEGIIDLQQQDHGSLLECQEIQYTTRFGGGGGGSSISHQTSLSSKHRVRRMFQWDARQQQQAHAEQQEHMNSRREEQTLIISTTTNAAVTLPKNNNSNSFYKNNHIVLALQDEDQRWRRQQKQHEQQQLLSDKTSSTSTTTATNNNSNSSPRRNELEASLASIMERQQKEQRHSSSTTTTVTNTVKAWFGYYGVTGSSPSSLISKRLIIVPGGSSSTNTDAGSSSSKQAKAIHDKLKLSSTPDESQSHPTTRTQTKAAIASPTSPSPKIFYQHQQASPAASPAAKQQDEEPLVGYWSWRKNSVLAAVPHKMMMELHLAKDSDLALHVVLAIVSNQVRSDRNL